MKRALVTGGTRGIGKAIVNMLLQNDYEVIATCSNNVNNEFLPSSPKLTIMQADQSDKNAMQTLVWQIKNKGSLDCLICNVGMSLRKELVETTDEEWEKVMQVNLNSNVFLIRDLMSIMNPNSRIILIGSVLGTYPHATSLAYGVTKAASHALVQNLVKVFDGSGTTINAVAPGFTETDWQKNKPEHIRQNIYSKTAAHRFAHVDEIADAVKFCLNNPYVNGAIIEVNGGYCYK